MFEAIQTSRGRQLEQPFYDHAIAEDLNVAAQTVVKLQEADADNRVWIVIAHEQALRGNVELFPKNANDWKEKGYDRKTKWAFLKEFEKAV